MISGKWLFDGQPIRFDSDGFLLDGQHRLNAIVKSGTSQKFLIIKGLQNETFKVMDTGKNRNGSDALSILGIKYSADIASACRIILNYNDGNYAVKKQWI